jgi:hypothetical protein
VKDGRKHGRGVIKFITGDVYDGQFEEDLYSGLGTLMLMDGMRYEGSFLGGFYEGIELNKCVEIGFRVIAHYFECRVWKAFLCGW